ncbi:MAG: hypothetical protein H0W62_05910 [Chitinophagales bacterium]|nr:hypothetical protein [Chitinophagales bacterium]
MDDTRRGFVIVILYPNVVPLWYPNKKKPNISIRLSSLLRRQDSNLRPPLADMSTSLNI